MAKRQTINLKRAALAGVTAYAVLLTIGAKPTPVWAEAPQPTALSAAAPLDLALQKASTVQVNLTLTNLYQMRKKTVYLRGTQEHVHLLIEPGSNRLRAEKTADRTRTAGTSPSVLVIDGSQRHELDGWDKSYVSTPAAPILTNQQSAILSPAVRQALNWTNDTFVAAPDETLADGSPIKVYLHTETWPSRAPGAPDEVFTRKVLVDPRTRLPLRVLFGRQASVGAPVEEHLCVDFSDWRLNAPIPAAQFVWTPPAGAVEVPPTISRARGTVVPRLDVEKWGGGALNLADYRGKTVLLALWSPSDGESRKSLAKIQEVLATPTGKDVAVIALCVNEDRSSYERWMSAHASEYGYTFAYDPAGKAAVSPLRHLLGAPYTPTVFILDNGGHIASSLIEVPGDYVELLTARLAQVNAAPSASVQ